MGRLRALSAAILLTACFAGCAEGDATLSAAPATQLVTAMGRSVCPGSIHQVGMNMTGHPADEVERLQGMFDGQPGFLGAVWDGSKAVAIVDARMLAQWQQRVAARGYTASPSCIDTALLAAVKAAQAMIERSTRAGTTAGYYGLDDAIEVRGIDAETLIDAIDQVLPDGRNIATQAIANGTLRIAPH